MADNWSRRCERVFVEGRGALFRHDEPWFESVYRDSDGLPTDVDVECLVLSAFDQIGSVLWRLQWFPDRAMSEENVRACLEIFINEGCRFAVSFRGHRSKCSNG